MQSVEVKVDAALIEQLRAGYRQLTSKGAAISLARGPLALQEGHARDHTPARGYWPDPKKVDVT